MAALVVEGEEVRLALTRAEHVLGLSRDLRAPLRAVRTVWVPSVPWLALRGWRSAGTSIPGKLAVGTWRHGGGWDFCCVHGGDQAVVVELIGQPRDQWIVGVPDAAAAGRAVAQAAGVAFDPRPVTYEPRG